MIVFSDITNSEANEDSLSVGMPILQRKGATFFALSTSLAKTYSIDSNSSIKKTSSSCKLLLHPSDDK